MDKADNGQDLGEQSVVKTSLKPVVGIFLLVALAMIVLLTTKNPGEGGPMVILLFLLLTFLLIMAVSVLVIRIVERTTQLTFSWLRVLYTSVAIAAGIVFLIGLRTLRQLQIVDVVLVVTFELLLNFYLLRRF